MNNVALVRRHDGQDVSQASEGLGHGGRQERLAAGDAQAGETQIGGFGGDGRHRVGGQGPARDVRRRFGEAVGACQVAVVVAVEPHPAGQEPGGDGVGDGAHAQPSARRRSRVAGAVGSSNAVQSRLSIIVAPTNTVSSTSSWSVTCGRNAARTTGSTAVRRRHRRHPGQQPGPPAASNAASIGTSPRRPATSARAHAGVEGDDGVGVDTEAAAQQRRRAQDRPVSLVRAGTDDGPSTVARNGIATSRTSGTCASAATMAPGSPPAKSGRANSGAWSAVTSSTLAISSGNPLRWCHTRRRRIRSSPPPSVVRRPVLPDRVGGASQACVAAPVGRSSVG